MKTSVKNLEEILKSGEPGLPEPWKARAIVSEQCVSYVAWNEKTKEAVLVDPKADDNAAYKQIAESLTGFSWVAVIDTHTHADHISSGGEMAQYLECPLVMHQLSPTKRVDLRVTHNTKLHSQASPLEILVTPGHTHDSITVIWGPFLFGGDTVLFGDSGRDDLPTGDAHAHFDSLELLKKKATGTMFLLPGHDPKGGQSSTWATQLKINSSLIQNKADFVRESEAYNAPAPALLKESLKENFK